MDRYSAKKIGNILRRILREEEEESELTSIFKEKGYSTPIVADIHFTPNAAEIAATIIEKVRVNPGNYVDKKKF